MNDELKMRADVDEVCATYPLPSGYNDLATMLSLAWLKGCKYGVTTTASRADESFSRVREEIERLL